MKRYSLLFILGCILVIGSLLYACKKSSNPPTPQNPIAAHINDGCWAYYSFKGGSLTDSLGHGHPITLYGASLTTDAQGNANGAIDFNLATDTAYALIADGGQFASDSFSISAYIMPRAASGIFFAKMNHSNGEGCSMEFGVDPRHNAGAVVYAGATYPAGTTDICSSLPGLGTVCVAQPWIKNTWNHIVATFNQGVESVYINGSLLATINTGTTTQLFCNTSPFIIGNWWPGDLLPYFNGKVSKIRIYSRAISAEEVRYLFGQAAN